MGAKFSAQDRMKDNNSRVTERNTSLHSGSIDSVQNSEAELQNFEAQ